MSSYDYPTTGGGATAISNGVATTVDCQKQLRLWRLLRSLAELLVPSCNCAFTEAAEEQENCTNKFKNHYGTQPILTTSSTTITGTIFGYRRGKASFCIQTNSKSPNPILLLELPLPTTVLAREMQGGVLRIALECSNSADSGALLSMVMWTMYCNGRKFGYAVKRRPSKADRDALGLMNSIEVGAGIVSTGKNSGGDHEIMYLRANFEKVCGSSDSESFHLIDPDGSIGQEFSIFFFRSR